MKILSAISKIFCKHPYNKSTKVYKHFAGETMEKGGYTFQYVVHIRKCNVCGKHIIDEGWEYTDLSKNYQIGE